MSKTMKLFCGVGAFALLFVAGSLRADYAISLTNASFEDPVQIADGESLAPTGWLSNSPTAEEKFGNSHGYGVNPQNEQFAGTTDSTPGTPANALGVLPDGGQYGVVLFGDGYDRRLNQVTGHTVTPGETLTLSFYAGRQADEGSWGNSWGGVTAKLVDGSGIVIGSQDFTTAPSLGAFSLCTMNATVAAGQSGLLSVQFFGDAATSSTYAQEAIDKVSLTSTPEPSVVMLLTSGLLGLLCYAWKKR